MHFKIVLASNNQGKLSELVSMLAPFKAQIINQSLLGINEANETGLTFIENAIIKARHACSISSLPCIADDSGLEVRTLNGKPGIYSSRFAGKNATDDDNNQLLLKLLKNVPDNQRQAQFRCVMVYMRHHRDCAPIIVEGLLEGQIIQTPQGEHGFGYDPLFLIPDLNLSCAQLSTEKKNQISHRAIATGKLINKLIGYDLLES